MSFNFGTKRDGLLYQTQRDNLLSLAFVRSALPRLRQDNIHAASGSFRRLDSLPTAVDRADGLLLGVRCANGNKASKRSFIYLPRGKVPVLSAIFSISVFANLKADSVGRA